jgi:DMSO/TMAO reductase YedYZ molybdopterin-dependent catalytic subunit
MDDKEKCADSLQPKDKSWTDTEPKHKVAELPEAGPKDASSSVPRATENAKPEAVDAVAEAKEQQVDTTESPSLPVDHEPRTDEATSSVAPKQETAELPEASPQDVSPSFPKATENAKPEALEATKQRVEADRSPSSSVAHDPPADEPVSSVALKSVSMKKPQSFVAERLLPAIEMAPRVLRNQSRRDFLVFGTGALATLAGAGILLPQETLSRMGIHRNMDSPAKEWFLNRALRLDDDVAEALYSVNRSVPTYTKSQITPLKNNYNGSTPDPGYISGWKLTLAGLASGLSISLDIRNLLTRFPVHEQITRLVCVEGWSAIAWWAGLRFDDLLRSYPPMSQANWARVESSVNLDASGNPDPYFMSIDLATARHPQTLLATHFNGQLLTVDHGAPLRLLVPMKLGLKNVKAITRITYVAEEPRDYWAERGYSYYDGI